MRAVEAIKSLLWEHWDPIGVNDNPNASGEYDTYAVQVDAMLARGADAEEIARHLVWSATELMGLGANEDLALMVARKIVALRGAVGTTAPPQPLP